MIVCFIGHRKVDRNSLLIERLYTTISDLIEKGADTFLFGSKSDFDSLCYDVVTVIREQFPHIKRICYTAPHEAALTSKEERQQCERFFSERLKHEVRFVDYEEAVHSQNALKANKNAYIARNRDMIDSSDICVFYYDKDYLPPKRKASNTFLPDYQSKSGTAIAFQYAVSKKKTIINVFNALNCPDFSHSNQLL